jgi:hypothetical protein
MIDFVECNMEKYMKVVQSLQQGVTNSMSSGTLLPTPKCDGRNCESG